jgi:hypothetical protein
MTPCTQRVLEGRQVRTLADMMDYCTSALAAARIEDRRIRPDDIELDVPQDMRLLTDMPGGHPDRTRVFSITVQSW